MPIMIEDMQAEILPERSAPDDASDAAGAEEGNEQQLLERVVRERRVRDERRLRWLAD